ncbi:MAG: hypothetical protein L3J81_05180, partial [Thermoplasmata archaeon]|nr:hypothetical protein [Thermoplasmata archaeon]
TNGHSQTGPGPNNFAQQHGVLPAFGSVVVPREGASLAALSTGSATVEDSDFQADTTDTTGAFKGCKNGMQNDAGTSTACSGAGAANGGDLPTGFPVAAPSCPSATVVDDVIDVKLAIKVPANASALSFDFDFHASDWPDYVCTNFNDSFIAYLQSSALGGGTASNVSFDTTGTPISVNSPLFGVCTPDTPTGCNDSSGLLGLGGDAGTGTSVCALGPGQLAGTGYYDLGTFCTTQSTGGGATGWLTSLAPVAPGETISLEFIIWDASDWNYDSSVLVDNLFWKPGTVLAPVTTPAPPN